MEIALSALLAVNVILIGLGVVRLAQSVERLSRRLQETSGKLDSLIEETRTLVNSLNQEAVPLASRAQETVEDVDRVAVKVYGTLEHADRFLNAAERLANTLSLAPLASKALQATSGGVASLAAGVREGWRALRHKKDLQNGGGKEP
ncbi:MAG: hypothetical protein IT210_25810 [Armatimonadetes bacterium]|nr:hypothetical protein [Armatimonadota bacterium]